MSHQICSHSGVQYTHTILPFLKNKSGVHPDFLNTIQSSKKNTINHLIDNVDSYQCYHIMAYVRMCLVHHISLHDTSDIDLKFNVKSRILLSIDIPKSKIIKELKEMLFIMVNPNPTFLIAEIFDIEAATFVAKRIREVLTGEMVITKTNSPPAYVLHSYDYSLKLGDCENFCHLAALVHRAHGNMSDMVVQMEDHNFTLWLNLALLNKITSVIASKEFEVYDSSDKLLQRYKKYAYTISKTYFNYDISKQKVCYVDTPAISNLKVSFK